MNPKLFDEEDNEPVRYYVCGIGYDEFDRVTDYEVDFGDFDTEEDAFECYISSIEKVESSPNEFFDEQGIVSYMTIQLEECVEDDECITCVDVLFVQDIERR